MTKSPKYTIAQLKEIHFKSTGKSGFKGRPRASINRHAYRPKGSIGRNDFNVNQALLTDLGIDNKRELTIMCANFPETKIQIIFNPKGLPGPSKTVKLKPKGGGITFGFGNLVEQFARENGCEITEKKNYFVCDLEPEITFKDGNMISVEFSVKKDTINHLYRD